jgi:hypothetical protein
VKRVFIPLEFRPVVPGSSLKVLTGPFFKIPENVKNRSEKFVVLSSQDDLVAQKVWESLKGDNTAIHLFLDELGYTWDFTFSNSELDIYTKSGKIIPSSIYHRHPGFQKEHPFFSRHIALFEVLDIWKGNNIGQRRDHFHNSSKPFQSIYSVLQAIKIVQASQLGIANTYLVKGDSERIKKLLEGSNIVKSCSSRRSIAATRQDYQSWIPQNVKTIPVLIQEKIDGVDYRVHMLDGYMWVLSVISKNQIDYRYSSKSSLKYESEAVPKAVEDFCRELSKIENNRFIGVDLIKKGSKYICLESNPGPGWSQGNRMKILLYNLNRASH